MTTRLLIPAIALLIWLFPSSNAHAAAFAPGMRRIETTAETASRGDTSGHLHILVWYPARAQTAVQAIEFGGSARPLYDAGAFAPGAALAPGGPFPFVVLSHGTGGTAMQLAWLARALVQNGYIVAAPDHPGNNALQPYTAQGFALWWLRARDLSAVIDAVLRDPLLGSSVDRKRIGAAGFSLGAYSVMELAGAKTDLARFANACAHDEPGALCDGPPEFPDLARRVQSMAASNAAFRAALGKASASYRDPRVRAIFAIAPPLAAAMDPGSLQNIPLPVRIAVGTADTIAPRAYNADVYQRDLAHSELEVIQGAGHYTFLDTCTSAGKTQEPELCNDAPGLQRETVHGNVSAAAVRFFNRTLKR